MERKKIRSRHSSEESNSSSGSSSLTSSSDEETDAKDLKPIKEYITNRNDLASQLFKSVKGEKIRMMLPQILKKVDFKDLEELCAAELTGMSKTRIMSIINGQEMLESSVTEDSDNSSPSLEIISDTDLISDNEPIIKIEGKKNRDSKKLKKKSLDEKKEDLKSKMKLKGKGRIGKDGKSSVKIKTEKIKTESKEKEKGKEGESLLDLLELEMRARAIRALIRKEEDANVSSTVVSDKMHNAANNGASLPTTSTDKGVKERKANLKEQLEKIDVLTKHGDDEDVFVVINPAPTIELLSSESDNEDHSKRVNKRLVSERNSESKNNHEKQQNDKSKDNEINLEEDTSKDKCENIEKNISKEKDKNEIRKEKTIENNNLNLPISVIEYESNNKPEEPKEVEVEEGEIVDDDEDEVVNKIETPSDSPSRGQIKKVKKNPHIRLKRKSKDSDSESDESKQDKKSGKEISEYEKRQNSSKKQKVPFNLEEPIEIEESPPRTSESNKLVENDGSKIDLDDDKCLDIEEIINLDDYPDEFDVLDGTETPKETEADTLVETNTKDAVKSTYEDSVLHSETWATRYIQQDDVQNVIKESKIQSEIRKRLRERQRQSKMNNSPKPKEPSPEPVASKPTGSVEEYLALKALSAPGNYILEGQSSESLNFVDNSSESVPVESHPVMIVKKAKLIGNRVVATKVDSTVSIEQFTKIMEENNSAVESSKVSIYENTLLLENQQSEVIKENSPAEDEKLLDEKLESTNDKQDISTTMEGEITPRSDSSDDNIIVKIGNISSTNNKLSEESNLQQPEISEQSNSKPSELRPD